MGIQSKENHEREAMSDENLVPIITVGLILAVVLHLFIYLIVKIIVWQAGDMGKPLAIVVDVGEGLGASLRTVSYLTS